jgi:pimeloyl-ACP methyl ester carboxylesterase
VTWKSHVDFFQGIYERTPVLSSFDIYFFQYSARWRQPPLYPDVTDLLRAFLESVAARYDTVVLVCHSQGGLLGKRYILRELAEGRGETMKVDRIVTLNTPHRGARLCWHPILYLATVLNWVSRLRKGLFLRQLAELAATSGNVRFLKKNWGPTYISPRGSPPSAFRRHIRSVTLASSRDVLVSRKSAEGFEIDAPAFGSERHAADSETMADYVGKCLTEHEDPLALEKAIHAIYGNPGELASFRQRCTEAATKLIQTIKGEKVLPAGYLTAKAMCLANDFRAAFERHPLRKLGIMEAFETYARKVLRD